MGITETRSRIATDPVLALHACSIADGNVLI
jgi:hypothetical protein